jgi:hypothetical protein
MSQLGNMVAKSSFISVFTTTRHQTPCQIRAARFLKPDFRHRLSWHAIHDCLPSNVLLLVYQSNEVKGHVTIFNNYTKSPGQLIWSHVHQWLRKKSWHLPDHLACTFVHINLLIIKSTICAGVLLYPTTIYGLCLNSEYISRVFIWAVCICKYIPYIRCHKTPASLTFESLLKTVPDNQRSTRVVTW